ncbi:choice-of-anchor P family protein [Paenarthrobacter sp. Z7-10]|uniref:choice-of-anchor P family protein n=1 Tax=Paenarthrobacter sp. Z7-10 TaxID=2787635 RepID=UPI0022A97AD1|nr:choice-of-anchor P family protein [Paenarthrobacter sp. Z7-10]
MGALTLVAAGPLGSAQATDSSITPTQVQTGFSVSAYGSYIVNADRSLVSGPTAYSSISCTSATGKTSTNNVAAANIPTVGVAVTSVKTLLTTTGKRAEANSTVAGANLLGGLITAGAITSTSSADKSTTGAFSGTNRTTIVNLKVLGLPIGVSPAPNTIIDLKVPLLGSLGTITLNGQDKRLVNGTYQVSTAALRVQILKSGLPGLKIGTDIRLGVSTARLTPPQAGYLTGNGFSTKASLLNGLVGSGATAYAPVKCSGGTSTANVAGATISGVLTAGAATTNTTGILTPTLKVSVTNTVAGLNVLNGLVTVDAIKAETSASRAPSGGTVTLTDTSTFTNLKITGFTAIKASVAPNTVVQVPGLGEVTLHKVVKTSSSVTVTMIQIVLNQARGSLPTGSKIQIGYSSSGVRN